MQKLGYVVTVVLLVIEFDHYVSAQSGMGCFRPIDEQLPGLIESFYGIDLGIELTRESIHVCTSEYQLSRTVMVEFTCADLHVCNSTGMAVLLDMDCFPGYGWFIRSAEFLDMFDATIREFVNCTYCINNSIRIELFPSYPSNSYHYPPSSHCLYLPKCYTDTSCTNVLESEKDLENIDTARDCCAGTNSGLAYKLSIGSSCHECRVHGFSEAFYKVAEGDTLTIAFQSRVKGGSVLSPYLKGTIVSEGAEPDDYEPVNLRVSRRNGIPSFVVVTNADNITIEDDEFYLIYQPDEQNLKTLLEQFGEFLRDKVTIIIDDDDAIEIVLSKSMYCFNESDPKAPLCFNLTTRNGNSECPVEFDISVVLNITRLKDAQNSNDIAPGHTVRSACADVNFKACESVSCVDLRKEFGIKDDNRTFLTQLFKFTLIPDTLEPPHKSIVVNDTTGVAKIKDDDIAIIKLEHTEYNVTEEEGSVEVCVVFVNPHPHLLIPGDDTSLCYLEFSVIFLFRTSGQTADPYTDYVPQGEVPGSGLQIFPRCARKYCRSIQIIADSEDEETEEFRVSIDLSFYNEDLPIQILDDGSNAAIKIQPTNKIQVELYETALSASEGGTVSVCVSASVIPVQLQSGFEFNVSLTTTDIGAAGPFLLELNDSEVFVCKDIPIYDDCTVNAAVRTFNVTLQTLDESMTEVMGTKRTTVVTVYDSDVSVVELEYAEYAVNESAENTRNNTFAVCLVFINECECPVDFIVYLSVSSIAALFESSLAMSPDDYRAVSAVVPLEACAKKSCINFTVINDGTVEEDEVFFATLELTPGLDPRIKLTGRTRSRVTIIDSNFAYASLKEALYVIIEGDSEIRNVCVLISAENMNYPVGYDFAVNITSDNGCIIKRQISIAKNNAETCYNITVSEGIDDDLVTGDRHCGIYLVDSLELKEKRITIDTTPSDILIKDNDVVADIIVGFRDPEYMFREGGPDVATVFVAKSGDSSSPFAVEISKASLLGLAPFVVTSAVASNLAGTVEFGAGPFAPDVEPYALDLSDDDVGLENNEQFTLRLSDPSIGSVTVGGNISGVIFYPTSRITILDNDIVTLGIDGSTSRTIIEGESTDVCVSKDTATIRTVNFDLTPQDGTTGGDDYTPNVTQSGSLPASFSGSLLCFPFMAISDGVMDSDESFNVVLESTDSFPGGLQIGNDEVVIIIVEPAPTDDDVEDTVIGDPLFTVPIPESQHLCYEIRGTAGQYFNFISDACVSVNAHYTEQALAGETRQLHVIDEIAIRAVDNADNCVNILVDRNGCTASINSAPNPAYSSNGVTVNRVVNTVTVNVPNCNDTDLEMEIICETMNGIDMLRFEVMRGFNLRETSHGLLAQFWNVNVSISEFAGATRGTGALDNLVLVTLTPSQSSPRTFPAWQETKTWDNRRTCLYAGNQNGGTVYEVVDDHDTLIEGVYTDYLVASAFSTEFKYSQFDEKQC